ncbi:MAG: TonB-dependent receptor, partial [Myxococcaceae bacterium]|nr:TonB-dependent receptor [Myxococcaceae bacterium]
LSDADFRDNPLRRYSASSLDEMQWRRTQVALSHELEAGALQVVTTAYRNDFDRTWRKVNRFRGATVADVLASPGSALNAIFYGVLTGAQDTQSSEELLLVGPNHRVFVSQGLQSVARWRTETGPVGHSLELGARYHYDSIRRQHTEDAFLTVGGALVQADVPTDTTADGKDSTHAVALHAVDAMRWGPLVVTPGLRLEVLRSKSGDRLSGETQRGGLAVLMPGLGLFTALSEDVGVFAGAYRGFSPPPPGQPGQVLPEESLNVEAGARWTGSGARVELIGFFNDYANLTNICTYSNGCLDENLDQQFDAGRAHIYGLEVYAEKTLRPVSGVSLPLSVAYTLTRTQLLEDFVSADPQFGTVVAGDELPYVPMHQLSVSAGVEAGAFGLHVASTFVDVMREVAGQGSAAPGELTDALLTFDVSASWRFLPGFRLYSVAQNVLDAHGIVSRRPFGARPNAPRMVQVGLKYEL